LIVLAPQLLGGTPGWATTALTVLSSVTAALAFKYAPKPPKGSRTPLEPIVVAQALAVVATLAHSLPLPAQIAATLAPDAATQTIAAAKALSYAPPSWIAFTWDPGGSYERVLYGVCALCTFCTARLLSRSASSTPILAAVGASAFLVAVVALAHVGLGATRVYGIYEPRYVEPPLWGPLMNPNNLAGLLALGTPVMLGLACRSDHPRSQRVAWAAAALVTLATAMLTRSRGGMAACMLGVAVFAALYSVGSWGDSGSKRLWIRGTVLLALVVGGAVGLSLWAGADPLGENYGDMTKLQMFAQELGLVTDHRWLGVGRGGFAAASSAYYRADSRILYAENILLQYAAEFGAPLALLVLGTFFGRLLAGMAMRRNSHELGGLAGVLAISLQNLVDFSLELTGVALVCAACLGASLSAPEDRGPAFVARWNTRLHLSSRTGVAVSGVASLLAALLFSYPVSVYGLTSAERDLEAAIDGGGPVAFELAFAPAVELHPADPTIAMLGAIQAIRTSSPTAPIWLTRAMVLAPNWSSPHAWAAHWLGSVGRWDQALSELQVAAERDPLGTRETLCLLLRARPQAEVALSVAPAQEPERTLVLESASKCMGTDPAQTELVDAELLKLHPNHPDATARAAGRLIERGDWPQALRLLDPMLRKNPPQPLAYDVAARAWLQAGQPKTAVQLIENNLSRFSDPYPALLTLADVQSSAGDLEGMRSTIERARGAAAGDVTRLASALNALATSELQSGNLARSMRLWKELYSLRRDPFALSNAANLASRLGDESFAREAARELCAEHSAEGYCTEKGR
jgi:hypothetical protein